MRLKLLLFFLFVVSCGVVLQAQTTKPYNNLIITEALTASSPDNYVELTNMGTETIDLSNFELGKITPWNDAYKPDANSFFRLPKKNLAPGKSYLISGAQVFGPKMWLKDPVNYSERITKPEMLKIADQLLYFREANSTAADTVTPYYGTLDAWNGRECWYVRHHFVNEAGAKDSVVVDQVGGVFDQTGGRNKDGSYDVAGVLNATGNSVLIRKASVKTGNVDFNAGRGLDLADSEWIPVKMLSIYDWRAVFWTAGNQAVGAKLDANTLVSKTPGKIKVDLDKAEITVPWGIRRNDSIMYQFNRKPGLAWAYGLSKNYEDSAYISMRTGDVLTLYVCGDEATIKEFNIIVKEPTADDNIVIYKRAANFLTERYGAQLPGAWGYRVTDGVKTIDTISQVPYATRIDTLYKYLEKPAKATWKISFVDGVVRPDLKYGDKLQVTSESGKLKEYFLKLQKFVPSANAELSSITWPDMPSYFKGDVAESYGWAGDTIPGFIYSKNNYVVKIPMEYDGIPALVFTKRNLNSKVTVTRAKTLAGTAEDRTVTYTVLAQNDSTKNVYTVRFEKEKDPSKVQPWIGEPFFSQIVFQEWWGNPWIEVVNPGTEILDLSRYMIFCNYAGRATAFDAFNAVGTDYANGPWRKYVPGKKWQDAASWAVQPRILEPDLAVNAIVYPGDVFVMTQHGGGNALNIYGKEVDVNFATGKNPWGYSMPWNNAIHDWMGTTYYMYKILNDSVVNGLKPAIDVTDFELVDVFGMENGSNITVGGKAINQLTAYTRKPGIYKGNTEVQGSLGKTWAESEWTMKDDAYFNALHYGWPLNIMSICDGIGSHIMDDVTMYRSTVASKIYKVSEGYSKKETIRGLTTGTTVTGFYANILKANADQTLTVKSGNKILAAADAITKGDSLIVLSADSTNTSKYILDVTTSGLSTNALLTSTKYTVNVTGTTGTIAGIKQRELLKNVFSAVVVPAGATLTITDANDAYMSLMKLNYDSAYVSSIATDKVNFVVIAEDGLTKITYQLKPNVSASDAYVTSDVYSVDQFASLIQFVPAGTAVQSLLANVSPCAGATLQIFDKAGLSRTIGNIYKDDKLIVTSADGKVTKAYYFSMLNFNVNKYLAYVISDDYVIDQIKLVIKVPATGLDIATFFAKLYPSFGAKLSVIDKNGAATTLTKLASYDKLLVTAADNSTTATYKIEFATSVDPIESAIKMYPNPTTDRVVINGLTVGNRVRVFNAVGVTLRDVTVDNTTEYVNLSAQPAGIYVFVISNGEQHINIQKIVKK
ncbi:MAG: T9SS type A sorting domain-containing protein [Prolixibacteraceae bacterium]|nr:T9SS type A sorting domain-containing protein [Prolixibacteraceae bacterium]